MHIIGTGRDAFLDFLRNLTPQAFLGASSLVVLSLIQKPWLSWRDAGYTFLVLALTAIVLLAVYANTSRFLDGAFSGSRWGGRTLRRIKARESGALRRSYMFLWAAWRYRRIMFFEFVVAVTVMYSCLFAVLIMATRTALGALGKR